MARTEDDGRALDRAKGCLLGQLAGDALGSQVEFMAPEEIMDRFPSGVRHLVGGGPWETAAGQPTDDSEMALALARTLVAQGGFDASSVRTAYLSWLQSGPFDVGATTARGLSGRPDHASQANGALMRISPLGIAGTRLESAVLAEMALLDAAITHPHPMCGQVNAIFVRAIAAAITRPCAPAELYAAMGAWAESDDVDPLILERLERAEHDPPDDFLYQQGWVLTAFHNAVYQLLHARSAEAGIIDTVEQGGDTDTNAAIAGALLGAVHGRASLPDRWLDVLRSCRPEGNRPGIRRPRPDVYWPCDAEQLAEQLLSI